LPHFQYVNPQPGQISPEKSPGRFIPQLLHAFASLIATSSVFGLTGTTVPLSFISGETILIVLK
jgi:hypothetical protein